MNGRTKFLWHTGLILLTLAVLVRALLPQGFMPVAAPDGIRMEMCGGSGPVTIPVDRESNLPRSPDEQQSTPCPYAVAGAGADLPPQIILPAPPQPAAALPAHAVIAARMTVQRGLRPPARGPPTLA